MKGMFPSDSVPHVDIIIPTRNSERTLLECLESLSNQTYPRDKYSVILIDDSSDLLRGLVDGFRGRLDVRIITAKLGPSDKRNLGVKCAVGSYVAFIDSDCIARANWLRTAINSLEETKACVVGGPNLTPEGDPLLAKCSGHVLSSFFGSGLHGQSRWVSKGGIREVDMDDLILCNVVIRKEEYQKVGGLAAHLYPGEETDLFSKLLGLGYRLVYVPDLVVYHHRRPLFMPYLRQIFGYAKGRGMAVRISRAAFSLLQLALAIFSILILLLPALLLMNMFTRYFSLIALGLYFVMAFGFSLRIAFRERKGSLVLILPVSFLMHHFVYGIGWIFGLVSYESKNTRNENK